MTDTIAAPAVPQAGTIHHLDPREIVVGMNVRLDPRLDGPFIDSIREEGVLVPVVGHIGDDGQFVVLYGQRRTLAAIAAERETIPAYVVAGVDEADRLVRQMAENDHRASLTTGERAKVYEQLSALGMTANQIAKRTATAKGDVEHAITIAKSELAVKALDRWDFLTLEQGAALAEFDDDPEALKDLTAAAQQGRFDHVAQRLRDGREEARVRAEFTAALTEQGVTVIVRPGWDNKVIKTLDGLVQDGERLTPESHAACPGHAAFVTVGWEDLGLDGDAEDEDCPACGGTGNVRDDEADEDVECPDCGGSGVADEEEDDQQQVRAAKATYVCTDWRKHGHTDRWASGSSQPKKRAAEMSDTEREAASAARRDVIDSNKAWKSAEVVRREWIATFLSRKTPPKGTGPFLAATLVENPAILSDFKIAKLRDAFVGPIGAKTIAGAAEPRTIVLALAHALAAYESQTDVHSWRNVHPATSRYLRFLAANGYTLSAVEERACAKVTE